MIRLTGWDASMLYTETPTVHMHTIKVVILDVEDEGLHYGIDDFRRLIASRLSKLPPFRYELVDIPFKFHHPMWRENCHIDLEYHIRPWPVAAPGGHRQLDDAVGEIASTPLDRTRPLWELYLLQGLSAGKVAVVCKIHHALADGIATANLLAKGMDIGDDDPGGSYPTDPVPSRTRLVLAALADHVRNIARYPSAVGYTLAGIRRVHESSRKLSLDLAWPLTPPPSFINHRLDSRRMFASATLPLPELKETARALEVTINDVMLAISAGALRTLRLRYDDDAHEPLLGSVPVGFDLSPDRLSGNKFSGMLVPLPTDVADPIERVAEARRYAKRSKESHYLLGPELICRWSEYLPPGPSAALFRWMSRRNARNKVFTMPISNVMGPRERGHVNGHIVSDFYSVGPLTVGSGLNITVRSYADHLNISVLADGSTLDDPHELCDAMVAEFVALRRAADLSTELTALTEGA